MTKQAKHMRNNGYNKGNASKKGRIVALALAGVLALGGAGAICMTTIGRSPGQPATATQTATAATKKAETKNNTNQAVTKASTKQAETKNNTKPASTKQAETKKARQQNNQQQNTQPASKPQPKPQPAPAPQPKPQPKPQQAPEPVRNESANMEAKYSADQCIAIACSHVGAGGAAKGEALNITCSGLTNGGGTLYYTVELDLGDMHYKVTVDAIDGKVISGDATHMGVTNPIDENGDVMDASALPEK